MNETIDFSKAPSTYTFCFNKECVRSGECLRYLAALHLPGNRVSVSCYNPNALSWKDGQCPQFRHARHVRMAYGMRNFFDEVPRNRSAALHLRLESHIGRYQYYRYRNGTKPIPPHHQEFIKQAFADACPHVKIEFERFSDELVWE